LPDDHELLAVLNRRFDELSEAIEESRTENRQRFERIGHRIERIEARAERFEEQTNHCFDRIEGEVRHVHARIESLQGAVRRVAGSVTTLDEKVNRHKADANRQFDDIRSLIRVSNRQLGRQVTALENRRE